MKDNRLYLRMECEYRPTVNDGYQEACKGEVKFRHAATAYYYEGKKNSVGDPNRQFMCCESHYEDYVAHWQGMWSNVPRG